jgi:hypothetical protein
MVTRRHWRATSRRPCRASPAKRLIFVDFQFDGAIGTPVDMPRNSRVTAHSRSMGLFTDSERV